MTQFNEYVADGVSRLYAFRFPAFEKSDLLVSLDGSPQVLGWSALGLNGGNGGAVEFETAPASGTIVRVERIKIPPQVAYLVRDENLADIQDKAQARANLDLYSTTQTDDVIAAAADSIAGAALQKAANLSDVADVAQARTNLGVYSTTQTYTQSEVDAALAALEFSSNLARRLAMVERNLAITVLRDQIGFGSSGQKMVNGIVDEFEDLSGLESSSGQYYPDGNYIHNLSLAGYEANRGLTASAYVGTSLNGAYPITRLNDGNPLNGTGLAFTPGTVAGFDLGTAYCIRKIVLHHQVGDHYATSFDVECSDDNNTWTWVATCTGSTPSQTHLLSYFGAHRYWRIKLVTFLDNGNSSYWYLSEIEMYEGIHTPANITVVSAATTAIPGSTNTEARLVLLHQPVDAVALNTDVTIEASRDGGTTWTAGTLVHEGAFDATTNILSAIVDLSGQPAGTAMKWRCKTFNSKEQRLHGMWMQWS